MECISPKSTTGEPCNHYQWSEKLLARNLKRGTQNATSQYKWIDETLVGNRINEIRKMNAAITLVNQTLGKLGSHIHHLISSTTPIFNNTLLKPTTQLIPRNSNLW